MPETKQPPTVEDRFWAKVNADGPCWEWDARRHETGYGQFHPQPGRTVYAHVFAWEVLIGPVPAGLELDHLCRSRHCVNPDHLEPVTRRENVIRSCGGRCRRGHALTPANTIVYRNGARTCRTCRVVWLQGRRKAAVTA